MTTATAPRTRGHESVKEWDAVALSGDYPQGLPEGAMIGHLVILSFNYRQRISHAGLHDLYMQALAGIEPDEKKRAAMVPRERAAADAWRIATRNLNEHKIITSYGEAKVLVRSWDSAMRHITLESTGASHFEYASPAASLKFDAVSKEFLWAWGKMGRIPALERLLRGAEADYARLRAEIDGEAVYRSLYTLLMRTNPVPMNNGTWMVWNDEMGNRVVDAVKKIIAGLNDANPDEHSVVNLIRMMNGLDERATMASAVHQAIEQEYRLMSERIARIMADPKRLIHSVAQIELRNLQRLNQMIGEYEDRFEDDTRRIKNRLMLLTAQQEELLLAVERAKQEKEREAQGT